MRNLSNRLIATEWINKNLPEGSSIAIFDSGYGIQLSPIKKFIYEELTDMPRYIVLEESPVKISSSIDPERKEIIQKFYYLLSEFKSINIYNKSNWFDHDDNFYMPFVGFKEIQRPGPNLYIYEKK